MKRLLLPLLAALALPNAFNAKEFTEIKPKYLYSYQKSSLVKWTDDGDRFLSFKGTTKFEDCFKGAEIYCKQGFTTKLFKRLGNKTMQNLVYEYDLNCDKELFDRKGDSINWNIIFLDRTAVGVLQKYCPIEEWSKLPNK